MTPEEIKLVKDSWEKVVPISETAAELFYGKLFELDPSVKPMFKGDMKEQGRKLMAILNTAVNSLDKLDTIVGRNGIRLSGGQRQRLAIARMILSDPKVVILDEATSALDTTTEEKLHRALSGFLQGRTTLIIAHRLSAIKQADRAFVFDGGRIIDQGHHNELLQRDGLYQELYGQRQQV